MDSLVRGFLSSFMRFNPFCSIEYLFWLLVESFYIYGFFCDYQPFGVKRAQACSWLSRLASECFFIPSYHSVVGLDTLLA